MKKVIVLVVVVAALAVSQVALAGSSTVLGSYGSNSAKPTTKVAGAVSSQTTPASTQSASTLPFTGADLLLVSAVGIGLLGFGLVLRRAGRDKA